MKKIFEKSQDILVDEPTYGYYSPSYASNVAFGAGKGTNNDLNQKISRIRSVITVPKSSVVFY